MPNQTPNLNLTKPLQTEYYNIDVHNANSDIIDSAFGSINTDKSDKLTQGNGIILTRDTVAKTVNVAVDPTLPASKLTNKLTINGKDFDGSSVINIVVGDELGSIKPWLAKTAPVGWLALDTGALVSRNTYADLWAWVQANAPLITDSAWTALAGTQNSVGSFSQGDGSTTFRLPKILDYIRGGLAADVGNWQGDAIRNITAGSMYSGSGRDDRVLTHGDTFTNGAFGFVNGNTNRIANGTGVGIGSLNFDASRVVPTADENRPKTIKALYCIKAVNYILK